MPQTHCDLKRPLNQTYHIPPAPLASAADFTLDSYLLHTRANNCTCGHSWPSSELYEVWVLKSSSGSLSRRLKPAISLNSDLECGFAQLKPMSHVLCFNCYEAKRPQALRPSIETEDSWRETLKRKYAAEAEPKTAPKTPNPKPRILAAATLDQL